MSKFAKESYSDFSYAVDLVMDTYKITNPVEIAEKIEQDLGMEVSILRIQDYLNKSEDYELESRRYEYIYQIIN